MPETADNHEQPTRRRTYEFSGKDWPECAMHVLNELDRNDREHSTLFAKCSSLNTKIDAREAELHKEITANAISNAKLIGLMLGSGFSGGALFKIGGGLAGSSAALAPKLMDLAFNSPAARWLMSLMG